MTVKPIFVIGSPRSGTTILAKMLGNHHEIAYLPVETLFLPSYFEWSSGLAGRNESAITKRIFEQSYIRFMNHQQKSRFLEKTPENILIAEKIIEIYPKSQFIHIFRNPLDVVPSWMKMAVLTRPDIYFASKKWSKLVGKALNLQISPKNLYHVRYEDFASRPCVELRKICEFLDLPSGDHFLNSASKLVSANSISKGQGSLTQKEKNTIIDICKKEMTLLGY